MSKGPARKSSSDQEGEQPKEHPRLNYLTIKSRGGANKGDCTKDFFSCDFDEVNNAAKCEFRLSNEKVRELELQKDKQFSKLMQTDNHILLFGQGSKYKLLERLARYEHKRGLNVMVIRGYLSSVTERTVLTEVKDFLEELAGVRNEKLKGSEEYFKHFEQLLKHNFNRLLLVIHSIDGPHLFTTEGQELISKLCCLPKVQVIGSFDNIGLPYRWNHLLLSNCSWVFYHVQTQENYVYEVKNRLPRHAKRQRVEESLKFIWKSLTKIQKEILKIIAAQELALLDNTAKHRFSLPELLEQCRNGIVLSSEVQLRDNLIEIIDHRVVVEMTAKSEQGRVRKQYMMQYDRKVLQKIASGGYELDDPA